MALIIQKAGKFWISQPWRSNTLSNAHKVGISFDSSSFVCAINGSCQPIKLYPAHIAPTIRSSEMFIHSQSKFLSKPVCYCGHHKRGLCDNRETNQITSKGSVTRTLMIKDLAMHFCFKTGATNSLCGFPGSPLLHNYVWHHRFTLRFSQSLSSGDLSFANSKVFFLTLGNQQLRIS